MCNLSRLGSANVAVFRNALSATYINTSKLLFRHFRSKCNRGVFLPSLGKISKKNSLKECVFVNSALKNTLLQTHFSAILPTG